jgi:DHA2 family multidrug resistance protein
MLLSRTDPRLLMSVGIAVLAGVTLWRTTFDQDVTFWQLVLPQLATGFGIPLFFVPLLGLSIAAVPASQTASAAGLVNFIRTMSGAFGTALATTAWDRATTSARVDLVGNLHQAQGMLTTMQAHGLTANQALHSLGNLVQSQAVMLATNRVFMGLAAIIAMVAVGVWFSPRPKGPMALSTGH